MTDLPEAYDGRNFALQWIYEQREKRIPPNAPVFNLPPVWIGDKIDDTAADWNGERSILVELYNAAYADGFNDGRMTEQHDAYFRELFSKMDEEKKEDDNNDDISAG